MNTVEVASYSSSEIFKWKVRRWFRRTIKVLILLFIISALGLVFCNYLSQLPRERFAKNYSYWERVKLGSKKFFYTSYLTLISKEEDPKNTKLPIVELYMKGKRLDRLNSNLPQSGRSYQAAKLKIGGEVYKVSARYRGDSINHWAFPNKSWRIRLGKDKFYEGMQYFNLNIPRAETQLSNWLGYEIARLFDGVLVPETNYVHFRFNRKFDGVRLLLEQPNQEFLYRRNLPAGKIYVGDIGSEEIYGGITRKKLYSELAAWEVRSAIPDLSTNEMADLHNIIRNEHNPYSFYEKISSIVDTEALLNYIAMLELVGSVHIDETHNGKFYFNPIKGKFVPIAWDTVAYFWKNSKKLDQGSNSLFRVVLSNPAFREKKDRILWKAISGKASTSRLHRLIKNQAEKIKKDIHAFPLKLHANDKGIKHISNSEWHESLNELLNSISSRNNYISEELSKNSSCYRLLPLTSNRALLGIQVASRAGLKVDKIKLRLSESSDGVLVKLRRRGLEDIQRKINSEQFELKAHSSKGRVVFEVKDHLFSKRSFQKRKVGKLIPATYVYEIEVDGNSSIQEIVSFDVNNSITGRKYNLIQDPKLEIPLEHKKNSIWWDPNGYIEKNLQTLQGQVRLTQDLIIDSTSELNILPGTIVKLDPKISILNRGGGINIKGTKAKPIKFLPSSNEPWGVIATNGGQLNIEHAIIDGASEKTNSHVSYLAPISAHSAKVQISNLKLLNGEVSLKESEVKISNSEVHSILSNPILTENSSIESKNLKTVLVSAEHGQNLSRGQAHGTPPRIEREFKFSLGGAGLLDKSLDDLSEGILKALEEKVDQRNYWNVYKHLDQNYYTDSLTKDFVFRDIYFDTLDALNFKHSISYRLRNRYKSLKGYKYHLKKPYWAAQWPYRLEFQAKLNRKELGNGFSTVEESRFEFRKESEPFSEKYLPPPPPWNLNEYIPYFQAGNYKGLNTFPGQEIYKYLKAKQPKQQKFKFEPSLVLLTERFRQHLNIKTPWGSGPNPEQSYIISLDRSEVYPAKKYLEYLEARNQDIKQVDKPESRGNLLEIEVEFERNISDKLDQEIEKVGQDKNQLLELKRLEKVREAFLADQQKIMEAISEYFARENITVSPAKASKYSQAYKLL